ncbi:MAG: hypothetical protein QGG36_07770 [Pirellulaceae bacterium]|nr:hypothetical protein [Pirellulaceae bacterium]
MFDPYHKWLGIPAREQPPNFYRLLGVELFEADPDVIEGAGDARMAHLRSFQNGPHTEHSQRLLNEVAAARNCLLVVDKRAAYDARLRAALAAPPSAAPPTAAPPTTAPPTTAPPSAAPALAPQPVAAASVESVTPYAESSIPQQPIAPRASGRLRRRTKRSPLADPVVLGVVVAGVLGLFALFFWSRFGGSGTEQNQTVGETNASGDPANSENDAGDTRAADNQSGNASEDDNAGGETTTADAGDGATDNSTNDAAMLAAAFDKAVTGDWVALIGERVTSSAGASFQRLPDDSYLVKGAHALDTYTFETRVPGGKLDKLRLEILPHDSLPQSGPGRATDGSFLLTHLSANSVVVDGVPAAIRFSDAVANNETKDYTAAAALDPQPDTGWRATPQGSSPIAVFSLAQPLSLDEDVLVVIELHSRTDLGQGPPTLGRFRLSSSTPTAIAGSSDPMDPPEDTPLVRISTPDESDLEPIRATVREAVSLPERPTYDDQRKRIQQLLSLADEASDRPNEQYVLWRAAIEGARDAGDARLAMNALGHLHQRFEIDVKREQNELLVALSENVDRDFDEFDSMFAAANEALTVALSERNYDRAGEITKTVYKATQTDGGERFRKSVFDGQKNILKMSRLQAETEQAVAKLVDSPDDPAANEIVGRWHAIHHDDWKQGLPYLAKAADERLAELSRQDLAVTIDDLPLAVADRWWGAGAKGEPEIRDALKRRAGDWYEKAKENATGLQLTKIDERLKDVDLLPPINSFGFLQKNEMPERVWVDLLGRVDLSKDVLAGGWQRRREAIYPSTPRKYARIQLPAALKGSYEFEFEVTTESGEVYCAFPLDDRHFALGFGLYGGKYSGLAFLDGKDVSESTTRVKAGIKPNTRYRIRVMVVIDGTDAQIGVNVGRAAYLRWQGPISKWTAISPVEWQPAQPGTITLGSASNYINTFHIGRVRILQGSGHFLRDGAFPLPTP